MIFISILILLVAKALPSLNYNISSIYFTRISSIIFIYSGILTLNSLYIQSIGSGIGIYSGLFQITQISQVIELFLLLIGSLILISWPLLKNTKTNTSFSISQSTDYSIIVLFSTLGSCLLITSSDLISLYLSIELQSFGLYVLSTLYRDSESSTSAGLKYFLLGGLSSCLILLGSGLIYSYTGLTQFESIYSLISVSEINYLIHGILLGLLLIIVGFLIKIAAAPLHNWSPDVYDDTPTIVTIWLTIMPKISILILLLELYTQISSIGSLDLIINTNGYAELLKTITSLNSNTQDLKEIVNLSILSPLQSSNTNIIKNLFLLISIISLLIGTIVGLAQTRIKRLLAYSTISHIGFMLLALSINTEQSIDSLLFYLIQYTITNLNIFLIIIGLSYIINNSNTNSNLNSNSFSLNKHSNKQNFNFSLIKDIRYISELKSQFFLNPLLSLSLGLCLFSMAGIPPLIGFFSKQFVLYSAVQSGYNFISVVAILVSVVSASYYLKIIKVLHSDTPNDYDFNEENKNNLFYLNLKKIDSDLNKENVDIMLTNFHSFLISSLTLSILLFIFKPSLILNSTQLLSLSLFYF
uniref:NADH-ubiquinone oxidoreductase chain 2 n=1 Tax=Tricholoma lobayense TaxID=2950985 RepID=A0A8X8M129_9AGAR|nr:NADH dehydrogenase subunit 2 [Tricholoma lobayense]URW98584.1 NADH dehydrogenase subunit 2 [Tricholoma lobayense]